MARYDGDMRTPSLVGSLQSKRERALGWGRWAECPESIRVWAQGTVGACSGPATAEGDVASRAKEGLDKTLRYHCAPVRTAKARNADSAARWPGRGAAGGLTPGGCRQTQGHLWVISCVLLQEFCTSAFYIRGYDLF